MKNTKETIVLGKTYNLLGLMLKMFGKETDYSIGKDGDWRKNSIPRKVEILIKMAGMIPYGDIRNEVEPFSKGLITSHLEQHHYWYEKRSTDSMDLILLGRLHTDLTALEPLKPPEYSAIMSEFRIDFEDAQPWRGWSPRLKEQYNNRIRQIIDQWRNTGEIRFLGIDRDWFRKYDKKLFKVNLLNGRIVGEVNYLTSQDQSNIVKRDLKMRQFIEYVIKNLAQKLGI